jgi:hypothetical protein
VSIHRALRTESKCLVVVEIALTPTHLEPHTETHRDLCSREAVCNYETLLVVIKDAVDGDFGTLRGQTDEWLLRAGLDGYFERVRVFLAYLPYLCREGWIWGGGGGGGGATPPPPPPPTPNPYPLTPAARCYPPPFPPPDPTSKTLRYWHTPKFVTMSTDTIHSDCQPFDAPRSHRISNR